MAILIFAIVTSGVWAIYNTPLDAIPDLSDVQVIIYSEWSDRSPDIIEDQVTYPIVTQLLSPPHVKAVRATSFFGFSLVYVIFDDGTDLYWAAQPGLGVPQRHVRQTADGSRSQLGPDATGVGWGLEYARSSTARASTTWPTYGLSRIGRSSIKFGLCPAWPKSLLSGPT